jgi:hypothetical protein
MQIEKKVFLTKIYNIVLLLLLFYLFSIPPPGGED